MSAEQPPSGTWECGGEAAAYVLGALDADEAETFRRHMATCIVCRDEVAAFQQVVDRLPMSVSQHAVTRRLRRRVLGSVSAEANLANLDRRAARRPKRGPFLVAGRLARPALALGMALALVLVTVGALELTSRGPSGPRLVQASVTRSPGSAELRLSGGHGELIVRHLPPPRAGRIYEVWVRRGSRSPSPTSALFSVTSAGAADVEVPGDLRDVNTIMVTQEPLGGSLVPTSAPVIVARLI